MGDDTVADDVADADAGGGICTALLTAVAYLASAEVDAATLAG